VAIAGPSKWTSAGAQGDHPIVEVTRRAAADDDQANLRELAPDDLEGLDHVPESVPRVRPAEPQKGQLAAVEALEPWCRRVEPIHVDAVRDDPRSFSVKYRSSDVTQLLDTKVCACILSRNSLWRMPRKRL